jgi:uncharacterized protein
MRIDHGDPAWLELATHDLEGAAAFYGEVFGWRLGRDAVTGGVTASVDGRPVARVRPALDGAPAQWTVWLKVDDVAQATSAAVGAGGNVVSPPMRHEGLGWHAVVEDPAGAEVALWEAAGREAWALGSSHGRPCWFDVLSTGFDEARSFYHAVGGWRYHYPRADGTLDTSEPLQGGYRHAVNGGQGGATAGILDVREVGGADGGSRWVPYLAVGDVDEACAAVTAAGGEVVEGPHTMPFGRMAGIRDPHGAELRVLRSPDP